MFHVLSRLYIARATQRKQPSSQRYYKIDTNSRFAMAARNSCTHITWSEAKNKDPGGGNGKKAKAPPKKQPHNQILAAKILAKNGFSAGDERKIQKAYRKQEGKAVAASAKHEEEREVKRLASLQEVRPYEQAKQKLFELALELQQKPLPPLPLPESTLTLTLTDSDSNAIELDELTKIAECKEMQINEILSLEAMMPEDFLVSTASNVPELQQKLDALNETDPGDETLLCSIAKHPPVSFILKLEIDEQSNTTDLSNGEMELVTLILLRVTPSPLYPSSAPPRWDFESVMVIDKLAMCSADKPLESLAFLDEKRLQQALLDKAEEILPYPCVYELGVTWLSEQVFEFLQLQAHVSSVAIS